mmetsp:Transcript_27626/g.28031  ORF Transcript_27626/g.28031 Transcript_27626/m.28031 type:complete len:168 (-) Transcript_27626:311-814(-)
MVMVKQPVTVSAFVCAVCTPWIVMPAAVCSWRGFNTMGLIHGISTLKNGTDTSMEQWHQIRRHLSGERVGSTTKFPLWVRMPPHDRELRRVDRVGNQTPIVRLHPVVRNDWERRGDGILNQIPTVRLHSVIGNGVRMGLGTKSPRERDASHDGQRMLYLGVKIIQNE